MQSLASCLVDQHDWRFLTLAAMVCGLNLVIAAQIHRSANLAHGIARRGWQAAAGVTGGFGLWVAHLIAILAFEPGARLNHHLPALLVSLFVSLAFTSAGLMLPARGRRRGFVVRAAAIAMGITYAELSDVRVLAGFENAEWTGLVVPLTAAAAFASSCAAMAVLRKFDTQWGRWSAAAVLCFGLGAVHFVAIAALSLCRAPAPATGAASDLSPLALALPAAATLLSVVVGVVAVLTDRRVRRAAARASGQDTAGLPHEPRAWVHATLATPQVLLRNPIVGFALALVVVIWFVTFWQQAREREIDINDIKTSAGSLARIIGQNVERTAGNLDTTLKYLRRSYERSGYQATWPSLISDESTSRELAVQIAAIDARGMMISSSAMLNPPKPIDLSDREHFKALAGATGDSLYISRPMVGRASGQRTVQFARRILDQDRNFGGIIVASLTTEYLSKVFASEALGAERSGVGLFGSDGIVRAGTGIFAQAIGMPIDSLPIDGLGRLGNGFERDVISSESGIKAVATQPLAGYPLAVRVVLVDGAAEDKAVTRAWFYLIGALIATVVILYVALTSVYNREMYEARIVRLAHFDPLTGISNRAQFKQALEQAFRQRESTAFALHLVDLDGFKFVNDAHGHPIGDKLLTEVAKRLRSTLRAYDFVSRLGGDEFAVIQMRPGVPDDAAALAARICRMLAEPFEIEGFEVTIGASIGVAMCSDANTGSDLLKATDLALYEAKAAGRGTHKFFDRSMEAAFDARRQMEIDLRTALAEEQFELYYQPIIELASGRLSGYEALVRWHHPVKGFVPPNDFIPAAEETGLIVPLGDWIVRKAVAEIAQCDPHLGIAVNCSTLQFKSVNFVDTITSALADAGLEPSRLELEITESIFMAKDGATIARLEALRALGVRLALDDFGTGYSALSYVMTYPFSTLKIDRSFTSRLCEDARGSSVVRAICALARSLGMRTIAEGVETEAQVMALKEIGCNEAQGYYYSKPKPAAEILVRKAAIAA